MKDKLQTWLHDLGVALGLIEPPLQPVPIRTDDDRRRRQQQPQQRVRQSTPHPLKRTPYQIALARVAGRRDNRLMTMKLTRPMARL